MGVEARPQTEGQRWPDWLGAVINGLYPLRRVLHGCEDSAVYLTEGKIHGLPHAAIKVVATEPILEDLQLRRWRMVSALSHPHLIRLLDSGNCQLGGRRFLFVVMEYADQTLAQVLPQRALTADEVQEMLPPALDALSYLHRKNLVHGQLKPANFLVVGDKLKLSADTVRHAGEPKAGAAGSSLYDPPEANHGRLTPAGDIWGLGITLVEALTQSLPWPDKASGTVNVTKPLPAALAQTVQRCLSVDPARRPSASELTGVSKVAAPIVAAPAPQRARSPVPRRAATARRSPTPRPSTGILAAAVALVALAVWVGWRLLHHSSSQQTTPAAAAMPAQSPALSAPTGHSVQTPANASPQSSAPAPKLPASRPVLRKPPQPPSALPEGSPSVVHVSLPAVPYSALMTIHGRIKVAVLVIVDPSGNVIDALVENPGPSSYFAHLAKDASGKWKFARADAQDAREWLLQFEFSRSGPTAHATPRS